MTLSQQILLTVEQFSINSLVVACQEVWLARAIGEYFCRTVILGIVYVVI